MPKSTRNMTLTFDSATRKLSRAVRHMHDVYTESRIFIENHVHPVPMQTHDNGFQDVWQIHVAKDPPRDTALIIGDCLFNLRSALDHFAYELATPRAGDPPKGTEFPIFSGETDFLNEGRGGGLYKIRGIDLAKQDAIKDIQPYHTRNGHDQKLDAIRETLAILHALNIRDKHRTLHVVVQGASNMRHQIRPGTAGAVPVITVMLGPFVGGTNTDVLRIRWPSHDVKHDVYPSIAVDIAISDAQTLRPTSEQLWLCDRAVREVFFRVAHVTLPFEPVPELPVISWGPGATHRHVPGRPVLPFLH